MPLHHSNNYSDNIHTSYSEGFFLYLFFIHFFNFIFIHIPIPLHLPYLDEVLFLFISIFIFYLLFYPYFLSTFTKNIHKNIHTSKALAPVFFEGLHKTILWVSALSFTSATVQCNMCINIPSPLTSSVFHTWKCIISKGMHPEELLNDALYNH